MCNYLVIWGYIYKNSPKQIIHLGISLYTVNALKNSFINLGHLGANSYEPPPVCLPIRLLISSIIT